MRFGVTGREDVLALESARLDVAERERRERRARGEAERQRREDQARAARIREGELAQARARGALGRLVAAGAVRTVAEARSRLALAHAAGVIPWQFAAVDLGVARSAAGVVLTPGDPVARRVWAQQIAARDADLMGAIRRASDVLGLPVAVQP
jgi:hypothetical protein